jgi:hypothetical protein
MLDARKKTQARHTNKNVKNILTTDEDEENIARSPQGHGDKKNLCVRLHLRDCYCLTLRCARD